jgi:hypothetical protein
MKIGLPSRTFAIALLAQIVFCLVAAPILAAERWAVPTRGADQKHNSQPIIQAAFDASDVRPEEVSDAGQRRGKSRTNRVNSNGILCSGIGHTSVSTPRRSGASDADFPISANGRAAPDSVYDGMGKWWASTPTLRSIVTWPSRPCSLVANSRESAHQDFPVSHAVGTGETPVSRLSTLIATSTPQNVHALTRDALPGVQPTGPPLL